MDAYAMLILVFRSSVGIKDKYMSYTNKYLITNGIESAEDVNSGTKETWYCPSALFSITAPMALAQDYDPCLRLHGHVYTFLLGKSELKFENKFFLLEFPCVLIWLFWKQNISCLSFFVCLFVLIFYDYIIDSLGQR